MHLSLDTMNMVDDSCLSPSNFHEMGKGGGVAVGGRVHSIDVILGFSKEQDPLLSPATASGPHKVNIDGLAESGKQQDPSSHPSYSGHLSSLRISSTEQQQYHGESSWRWILFYNNNTTFWEHFISQHKVFIKFRVSFLASLWTTSEFVTEGESSDLFFIFCLKAYGMVRDIDYTAATLVLKSWTKVNFREFNYVRRNTGRLTLLSWS